jgi:hypothetical protein
MYSAWKTSWVSGLCVISAGLIYTLISTATLPDPVRGVDVLQTSGLSVIAFAIYAVVIIVAVWAGLRLAGSSYLTRRSAITIPLVYLVVIALTSFIPIRTHAVLNSTTDWSMAGVTTWFLVFGLVFLPVGISFIVGRWSRAD